MNRRAFLARTGLGVGSLALSGGLLQRLARAAESTDRYYVFCYFEGGWDHLLALDPRDPAEFTSAAVNETGIEPAWDLLPADFTRQLVVAGGIRFGPAIGEMAELTDHFSVVRGINMATLTHEVGRRYFITGRPPSGSTARGSSVASLASWQLGSAEPVPHLSLSVESYLEPDLPAYAAAMPVAGVDSMRYILRENLGIPTLVRPGVKDALARYWERARSCDDGGAASSQLAETYRDNRARAVELVKSDLWREFEFSQPQLASVRAHYGLSPTQLETPFGRAALASQAIKTGLSRVVSVALAGQLDTHDGQWAAQHSTRLRDGFDALARLITDLRDTEAPGGGSLLDKTTLVAFSEFGRTARLNSRGGRDHLLTNCALLAGAGIAPGRVVGSSSDNAMGPDLVDLATGQPSEDGVSLKPEHVMSTVLAAAGIPADRLRSEPLPSLLL
ncbi:MAG: DUF1501 domain-containing protein [Deltaproteobacteria bacterium]|nr:DUF1501 domain-containing protein [Deltaproteobacteria bacterium]